MAIGKTVVERPSEETKPLNILQRINEVRKAVSYIRKNAKVDGKYTVATHDAVTAALNEEIVKHGIIIIPQVVQSETVDTGKKTKSAAPIIRYEGTFNIVFMNEDDQADTITATLNGHGEDFNDKAPGKALSYVVKYAKLKVFDIETGDSDEERIESAHAKLTAESHQKLRDVCNELGMDPEPTLEALSVNVYKLKVITDMNDQWAEDAEKRLRAKAAAEKDDGTA